MSQDHLWYREVRKTVLYYLNLKTEFTRVLKEKCQRSILVDGGIS